MELLLDSHSLLWAVFEPKKLSLKAKQAIALPENIVYVSIVSLWEIGIKQNIGRLSIPARFFESQFNFFSRSFSSINQQDCFRGNRKQKGKLIYFITSYCSYKHIRYGVFNCFS